MLLAGQLLVNLNAEQTAPSLVTLPARVRVTPAVLIQLEWAPIQGRINDKGLSGF